MTGDYPKDDRPAEWKQAEKRIAALEADLTQAVQMYTDAAGERDRALADLAAARAECAGMGMTIGRISRERDEARAEAQALRESIALAYGHLWHVNNEPVAPIPLYSPERASYAARKVLRELLTSEQRGEAINKVGRELGVFEACIDVVKNAGSSPDAAIDAARKESGE